MARMKGVGVVAVALVAAIVCAGAVLYIAYGPAAVSADKIKQFSSCEQIREFVAQGSGSGYMGAYSGMATGMRSDIAPMAATTGAEKASDSVSQDFSSTNVQVAGVDEADIVKNDGKYIYAVSGNSVNIIDAYPAEGMKLVSSINETGVNNIFINGDRLVILGYEYQSYSGPLYAEKIASSSFMPYWVSPRMYVHVYDVTDRSNPYIVKNISLEGSYIESRMIGDYVYFIASKSAYYGDGNVTTPLITSGGQTRPACGCADVYYFDNPDSSYQFTTIASLNVKDSSDVSSKVIVTGYTSTVYVSGSNIYLSYQKQMSYNEQMGRMLDAVLPLFPVSISSQIQALQAQGMTDENAMQMGQILNNYMYNLTEVQIQDLTNRMQEATQAVYEQIYRELDRTVIQKVSISSGNIEYVTSGEVPGRLLNQFSMDEYNGYLRAATTSGQPWSRSGPTSSNNVYVLDGSMNVVGKLEGLAQGESIYSVRFMGEKAYVVTFKKIDPLFVISLADPANPSVLGQLKIPGYSNYLHPYDENHVIGIGKEAVDAEVERDFAWYQGVKLSLFDVTNVEHPVEVSKYVIGDRGTDSESLNDHKAFLFDRGKGLLVIPITLAEIDESKYPNGVPDNAYGDFTFQGAYVFSLDLSNGFQLRGRVTHTDNETLLNSGYYFYSEYAVRRSLYMDNALYTISNGMVKANSLADLSEIGSVRLPVYYEPYPILY